MGPMGKVRVHHHYQVSVGGLETVEDGTGQAKLARSPQHQDAGVALRNLFYREIGAIGAVVIHYYDLVVHTLQRTVELPDKLSHVVHFIVRGNNNGDLRYLVIHAGTYGATTFKGGILRPVEKVRSVATPP